RNREGNAANRREQALDRDHRGDSGIDAHQVKSDPRFDAAGDPSSEMKYARSAQGAHAAIDGGELFVHGAHRRGDAFTPISRDAPERALDEMEAAALHRHEG